jgi:hypothetical protein
MPPKGKCDKCGQVYIGWALKYLGYRWCDCGGEIVLCK